MLNRQSPLGSGFDAFSTGGDVMKGIDLSGRTAIVTGGYSGLGLEMTRALTEAGASVIVPVRTARKAKETLSGLPSVEQEVIDLRDPRSIDAFASRFLGSGRPLDILIGSAGIMASPLGRDGRGNESQFAVNHLGHFRLAALLAPALRAADAARVVSMSSRGHRISPVDFDDLNFERREYDPWVAYGQSKSANALFAVALDRRARRDGVRAFSVHPGSILTDLARFLSPEQIASFGAYEEDGSPRIDPARDMKTPGQGAATALWTATSPLLEEVGGQYCEDCDVAPLRAGDDPRPEGVRPWAVDSDDAERLWKVSEALEGIDGGW